MVIQHPRWAFPVSCGLLLGATVLAYWLDPDLWPSMIPDQYREMQRDVLAAHVTAVAAGFPLLILIAEFGRGGAVQALPRAEALMRSAPIAAATSYGFAGIVILAVGAAWFDTPSVLTLHLAIFVSGLFWLGYCYWRVVRLLIDHRALQRATVELVTDKLRLTVRTRSTIRGKNKSLLAQLGPHGVGHSILRNTPEGWATLKAARAGVVNAITHERLSDGLRRIEPKEATEFTTASERVLLLVLIGEAVREGDDVLAYMGKELSPGDQRHLLSAFQIERAIPGIAAGLEDHLRVLRDAVRKALTERRLKDVEDGLLFYEQLIRVILSESASSAEGIEGLWYGTHGPEMHWLQSDTYAFGQLSLASDDPEILRAFLAYLFDLMRLGIEKGELALVTGFRGVFASVVRRRRDQTSRSLEYETAKRMLSRLASFDEVTLWRRGPHEGRPPEFWTQLGTALLDTYAEVTRPLILQHIEGAPSAADEIALVVSSAISAVGREGLRGDADDAGHEPSLDLLLAALGLGLDAFTLMAARHMDQPARIEPLLPVLAPLKGSESPWGAYHLIDRLHLGQRWSWTSWEMDLRDEGGGPLFITFEYYLRDALLLALLRKDVRDPELPSEPADFSHLRATKFDLTTLAERLGGLSETYPAAVDAEKAADLGTRLKAAVSDIDSLIRRRVVAVPLDAERLERFFKTAEKTLQQPTPLVDQATRRSVPEPPAHEQLLLGFSEWVPKDFFTDVAVHADPESMGRDAAHRISDGRSQELVAALLPGATQVDGGLPELADHAIQLYLDMRAASADARIICLGPSNLPQLLRERMGLSLQEGDSVVTRVLVRHAPAGCIVGDLAAVTVIWKQFATHRPGESRITEDGRTRFAVEVMTAERAARAADDQGVLEAEREDFILNALQTVLITADEAVSFEVADPSRVRLLLLGTSKDEDA